MAFEAPIPPPGQGDGPSEGLLLFVVPPRARYTASMRAAPLLALAWSFSLIGAACLPSYDFEGATSDAGADRTTPETGADVQPGADAAPSEAGLDATANADADASAVGHPEAGVPGSPVSILDAGAIQSEPGESQQRHLVFAVNDGRYWLFYIDTDTRSLKTLASADLSTWTPGATLTLPESHGNEGAQLQRRICRHRRGRRGPRRPRPERRERPRRVPRARRRRGPRARLGCVAGGARDGARWR